MPYAPAAIMQAVLLTGHGGLERLVVAEVPTPTPLPGEVSVRLGAAAVNNTDINLRVGWYSKSVTASTDATTDATLASTDAGWAGNALAFPRIQGADGAGRIIAVGTGVDPARIGERVVIDPIWRDGSAVRYFGSDTPGAFAQVVCVPQRNAVVIHSALSDAQIASFPCSYLAALHMVTRAAVGHGQRVLVTGASGGVGTAAVQWAIARGARVVAVAEPSKASALLALGAEACLPRDGDLRAQLGVDSVDAVLDVVGGDRFASLLEVLRPRGHYATAGAIAGPIVPLDLRTLYLKDLTLHGCTIPPPELFPELVRAIEAGIIKPVIAHQFPLVQLADAQAAFLRKQHIGKIVLTIA
jgi:NADPH:quinone reductase-like Zn-dependent oxidoreductase